MLDPSIEFRTPEAVLEDESLSSREKLAVLRHWEYDQREIAVAQYEGMSGPDPDLLHRIRRAIAALTSDRGEARE